MRKYDIAVAVVAHIDVPMGWDQTTGEPLTAPRIGRVFAPAHTTDAWWVELESPVHGMTRMVIGSGSFICEVDAEHAREE